MAEKHTVGVDLTEGPVLSQLIVFVIPLLLANILQQLYNVVDMIVIGQFVGNAGTVGVSTGGELATLITFVATSFGSAGQIYVAQLRGAKEENSIREMTGTLISLMAITGLICMAVSILFCRPVLSWLNCPEEAFGQAAGYMIVVSVGLPFIFGYNALCGIMRGMGEAKRPLYFVLVATIANIVMDILLVTVIPLEAIGTAIATVIAQIASFAAAARFVLSRRETFGLDLKPESYRIHKKHVKVLMKLGIPLAIQSVFIHFSQLICTSYINKFGIVASATNSIGSKLQKFITAFISSVTTGAGAMVGQCLGARNYERVKKIVYTTIALASVLSFFAILIAVFLPRQAYALFTKDPDVIESGVTYMHICILIFIFNAVQGAYMAVVTGSGQAKLSFLAGMLDGIVLRLGISFAFSYLLNMGVVGFFYGNALARLGPIAVGMAYYYSGKWKTCRLLDGK